MDKCFDIKCLNKKNIVVEEVDVFLKNNKLSGEFDIYYLKSENKYIYSDKDHSKVLGVVDFDMEESRWIVVHLREKTKDVRESQNDPKATRTRNFIKLPSGFSSAKNYSINSQSQSSWNVKQLELEENQSSESIGIIRIIGTTLNDNQKYFVVNSLKQGNFVMNENYYDNFGNNLWNYFQVSDSPVNVFYTFSEQAYEGGVYNNALRGSQHWVGIAKYGLMNEQSTRAEITLRANEATAAKALTEAKKAEAIAEAKADEEQNALEARADKAEKLKEYIEPSYKGKYQTDARTGKMTIINYTQEQIDAAIIAKNNFESQNNFIEDHGEYDLYDDTFTNRLWVYTINENKYYTNTTDRILYASRNVFRKDDSSGFPLKIWMGFTNAQGIIDTTIRLTTAINKYDERGQLLFYLPGIKNQFYEQSRDNQYNIYDNRPVYDDEYSENQIGTTNSNGNIPSEATAAGEVAAPKEDKKVEEATAPKEDKKVEEATAAGEVAAPKEDKKVEEATAPKEDKKVEEATAPKEDKKVEEATAEKEDKKVEEAASVNTSIVGDDVMKTNDATLETITVDMQTGTNGPYTLPQNDTETSFTFTPSQSGAYTFENELTPNFFGMIMKMQMTFDVKGVIIPRTFVVEETSPNFVIDMTEGVKYTIKITNLLQKDPLYTEEPDFYVEGTYKINISLKEAAAAAEDEEENAGGGDEEATTVRTFSVEMGPYTLPPNIGTKGRYLFTPSIGGTYTFETLNTDETRGLDTNMEITNKKNEGIRVAENNDIDWDNGDYMSKIENITLSKSDVYEIKIEQYFQGEFYSYVEGNYKIKISGPGAVGSMWNDTNGHKFVYEEEATVDFSVDMGPYTLPPNDTVGTYIFTPSIGGTYTFETINVYEVDGLDTGMRISNQQVNEIAYNDDDDDGGVGLMSKLENIPIDAEFQYTINITNVGTYAVGGEYEIKISGPGAVDSIWDDTNGHKFVSEEDATVEFSVEMGPYTLPQWTFDTVGTYIFTPSITGTYTFETINVYNVDGLDTEMRISDDNYDIEESNDDIDNDNDDYMSKLENISMTEGSEYTINIDNMDTGTGGPYDIKVSGPGVWNDSMWNDDDGHDEYQEGDDEQVAATVNINDLTNNLISNPDFQGKIIELLLDTANLKILTDGVLANEKFTDTINKQDKISNIIMGNPDFVDGIKNKVQNTVNKNLVAIQQNQVDEQIRDSGEFEKINKRIEDLELDNI